MKVASLVGGRGRVTRSGAVLVMATLLSVEAGSRALDGGLPSPVTEPSAAGQAASAAVPDHAFAALNWRGVGPNRGGRSIAVAGVSRRPHEYYFGATGGGLWKTTNGAASWFPVGEGQFRSSSVGAIDVCAANPDIVYIGFGEVQLRGNVIPGDGVYRSGDAGRTWQHVGLGSSTGQQMIGRVRVHPENCDVVYAAAFGDPFGPSPERGVFRSRDAGKTWQKVLFRNDRAGAVDLAIATRDPRVIYAGVWEAYRNEWSLSSGGAGSGLFKSTDGGDTWTELTRNAGLPREMWGKVAVSVSDADANRVYANIEASDGGVFASDDAGRTWRLTSGDRNLRTRAFYYTRITADPQERDTVYVNNESFWRSRDGGVTWEEIRVPHGDNHDLWIDPANNQRLIQANDGGANVSVDAGRTWTSQAYPTAQMYVARTTAHYPYHICGAQQDQGGAFCLPSDGTGTWWYNVGGGESGWVIPDPANESRYYAGSQTTQLTRLDRSTGQLRSISPWPIRSVGRSASDVKERFQWTFPIAISSVDPNLLFTGSQHVWRSTDRGTSWERISPDLTHADPATLGPSGGPLTLDRTTVEHYATIFAIAPSRHDRQVIWAGSDDGLVHVTRDGGAHWLNVTPPGVPKFSRVSEIDSSAHRPGKAIVAITRVRMQDVEPYIWKTVDFGRTWLRITSGIRQGDHVRSVVEDPAREGLLFAGTENGVYVSLDDGGSWQSLQRNLPVSPVYALTIHGRDLVAATHGRGFYVLDDLSPLRQMSAATLNRPAFLYRPAEAVRNKSWDTGGYARAAGVHDARIYFHLKTEAREVRLEILDAEMRPVREIVRRRGEAPAPRPRGPRASDGRSATLEPGLNVVTWNLRYPGFTTFPGLMLRFANTEGPTAPPGTYHVRLTVDGTTVGTEPLTIRRDPRVTDVTDADLGEQFRVAMQIRDTTSRAHEAVVRIRELRSQVMDRMQRTRDEVIRKRGDRLAEAISDVEREIYEVRLEAPEDQLNFGLKLNNDLAVLQMEVDTGDGPATAPQLAVFAELTSQLGARLAVLDEAVTTMLPALNEHLVRVGLAPITFER